MLVSGVRLSVSGDSSCNIDQGSSGLMSTTIPRTVNMAAPIFSWEFSSFFSLVRPVHQLAAADVANLANVRLGSGDHSFQSFPEDHRTRLVIFHVDDRIGFDEDECESRIVRTAIFR